MYVGEGHKYGILSLRALSGQIRASNTLPGILNAFYFLRRVYL
jgi:hypothetical protein